jgi:hypothetical protein
MTSCGFVLLCFVAAFAILPQIILPVVIPKDSETPVDPCKDIVVAL